MTYTAVVMPAQIACGKCGRAMHVEGDGYKPGATSVVVSCWKTDCEQHDIPLVFPLEVRELERAEA